MAALAAARVPTATAAPGTATINGYVSRPDLNPPAISFDFPADGTARGSIFLAPFDITAASGAYQSTPNSQSHSGPLIVDDFGEPIWFLPLGSTTAMDVRLQQYQGRTVLTWYEGTVLGAEGGGWVVFDPTYHEVARVRAGRGRHGDLHDLQLTPEGTALITIYREVAAPTVPRLVTGIVQEIEVASGRVLFEWRSNEHIGLDESYMPQVAPAGNVDYFHLNSIDIDTDGNLLLSARNTSAIYKVDRKNGKVMWRLGGKKSDFAVDAAASFAYQHDVRRRPDGTITIFDNNAAVPGAQTLSRGLRIKLDMKTMRASFVTEYLAPTARTAWAMGDVQQLDDGGVFIGWGTDGSFTELGPDGSVRLDGRFAEGSVSYRAFRFELDAKPKDRPATEVLRNGDGSYTVYVSWNGATRVAKWQVVAGSQAAAMKPVLTVPRSGFETAIPLGVTGGMIAVVALDAHGKQLRASAPTVIQA
ncbi:MAG TPA: arylsulfotransferase family protein [Gaiellaceae bacterium]|nr:arylsulfotransferase family protein [Gaiellaceae bacterium]